MSSEQHQGEIKGILSANPDQLSVPGPWDGGSTVSDKWIAKVYYSLRNILSMIGSLSLGKADDKGGISIPRFKGKDVYLVDLGSGYFITDKKDVAQKVAENASRAFDEEFLKLVEELGISAEEIDERIEKEVLKKTL
jgi:hypothetical protein